MNPTADNYESNLRRTLEVIQQNIPRVFVNLVPMANLSQVYLCVVIQSTAVCTNTQLEN